MLRQNSLLSGGIVALIAFVRFHSSVNANVLHQVTLLNGGKVALIAFVRFISSVSANVDQ